MPLVGVPTLVFQPSASQASLVKISTYLSSCPCSAWATVCRSTVDVKLCLNVMGN
jgi:hypothetical protein